MTRYFIGYPFVGLFYRIFYAAGLSLGWRVHLDFGQKDFKPAFSA